MILSVDLALQLERRDVAAAAGDDLEVNADCAAALVNHRHVTRTHKALDNSHFGFVDIAAK